MTTRPRQGPTAPAPHPVLDEDLISFAADDPGLANATAVAGHVAVCPECAATVARYRLVRQAVRADAALAPSPAALAHVRALAGGLGRAQPAPASPFAGLRRLVAALGFDGLTRPAFAGLRGADQGYQLAYAVDGIEIDLQVDPPPAGGDRWQVMGQLAGTAGVAETDVVLAEPGGDDPFVRTTTDDDGLFSFEAAAGTYDVLLRLPEGLLVLPGLALGRRG